MDWIATVNGEAKALEDLAPDDPVVLRQLLYRRLRERLEFPLETGFEAVVKGDRRLEIPDQGDDYLELVPGDLEPTVYDVLGGILVEADRPLGPGSIVEAVVEIDDPERYVIDPPAMLGRLEQLEVKLGVTA